MASAAKMARTGKVVDRKTLKVGVVQKNILAADDARFEFFGTPVYADTKEPTGANRRISAGPTIEAAINNASRRGWKLKAGA